MVLNFDIQKMFTKPPSRQRIVDGGYQPKPTTQSNQ